MEAQVYTVTEIQEILNISRESAYKFCRRSLSKTKCLFVSQNRISLFAFQKIPLTDG